MSDREPSSVAAVEPEQQPIDGATPARSGEHAGDAATQEPVPATLPTADDLDDVALRLDAVDARLAELDRSTSTD